MCEFYPFLPFYVLQNGLSRMMVSANSIIRDLAVKLKNKFSAGWLMCQTWLEKSKVVTNRIIVQ